MNDHKPKTPRPGGEKRIREAYEKQRKRKPSQKLLDMLRKDPKGSNKDNPEDRAATPKRPMDAEL